MTATANEIINNAIKAEVSKIIPNDGNGLFLRKMIFGNPYWDWYFVAQLVKEHFPEKAQNIQRILDYNLSDTEKKQYED